MLYSCLIRKINGFSVGTAMLRLKCLQFISINDCVSEDSHIQCDTTIRVTFPQLASQIYSLDLKIDWKKSLLHPSMYSINRIHHTSHLLPGNQRVLPVNRTKFGAVVCQTFIQYVSHNAVGSLKKGEEEHKEHTDTEDALCVMGTLSVNAIILILWMNYFSG